MRRRLVEMRFLCGSGLMGEAQSGDAFVPDSEHSSRDSVRSAFPTGYLNGSTPARKTLSGERRDPRGVANCGGTSLAPHSANSAPRG